jgi:hypothetical protein
VLGDKRRAAAAAAGEAIFFFHRRDFEKINPWGYQKRVSQSSTTAQNPQTIEELLLRCVSWKATIRTNKYSFVEKNITIGTKTKMQMVGGNQECVGACACCRENLKARILL